MKRVLPIAVLVAVLCGGRDAFARGPGLPRLPRVGVPNITIGPIISSDSASCVIPFTRIGNLILIRAKADTADGYFVLDTGAPGLVLNITYFRSYPVTNSTDGGGITGSAGPTARTAVDSLRIGPVSYLHVG